MTRARPRLPLMVVALVLAAALIGCGGDDDPVASPTPVPVPTTASATATADPVTTAPTTSEGDDAPGPSPSASATPSDDPGSGQGTLDHFLVRDGGGRLWVEPVTTTYDVAEVAGAVAREAVTRLLAAPDGNGLVNLVPDGTTLLDIGLEGGLLTVDLSGEVTTNPGAGGEAEAAFAQSLAHTGGQFATVDAVRLLVDGAPVAELWGHLDWSQPIAPDEFAISPIVVEQARGTSGGRIELSGTANTFEASFGVVVADEDGTVVDETFAMATCGSGCRGDWTYELADLEPGVYTVTLTEDDPSDGEGRPPFTVALDVRVPA
jgi:hypothetical protein